MTILTTDRPAPQLAQLDTFDFTTGYRDGLRAAYRELTEARDRGLQIGDDTDGYSRALDDLASLLTSHGIDVDAEHDEDERRELEEDDEDPIDQEEAL